MPDLIDSTAELVNIFSQSFHESVIADFIEIRLKKVAWLSVVRVGDAVVAKSELNLGMRLVLAGHTDTVPPSGNLNPVIEGDMLHGLGSADMKGGLAVMLALAGSDLEPQFDVTFVFYPSEEVDHQYNGLSILANEHSELVQGDAAILLEPTSAVIEAGCQGVIRVELLIKGKRAHSARPWMGVNAIHRSSKIIEAISQFPEREPEIDGCRYHEVTQCVGINGGVAGNVIPDEVSIKINHRSAPDRTSKESISALEELIKPFLEDGDEFNVTDVSESAHPGLNHPLLQNLVEMTDAEPRAKLGWTDVSFFASLGIPAVNFGPGDPALAHGPNECVHRTELESVFRSLFKLIYGVNV